MTTMRSMVLIALTAILSACSTEPLVVVHVSESNRVAENRVYVANHGWHTGFVIPAAAVRDSIPELKHRFKDDGYIEIGWGDRGFYQTKEITAGLAIRAIFWPTESVIHTVAVPAPPREFFPSSDVEELPLSDGELSSLIQFISESLYRDGDGKIIPLGNGLYGDSQFYRGVGDYHLMNTCNKWTAKGLKSTGMDISPTFKLTAGSIMDGIRGDPKPTGATAVPIRTER
jgi:uncharacterized protein (TIGR02117 family)